MRHENKALPSGTCTRTPSATGEEVEPHHGRGTTPIRRLTMSYGTELGRHLN